MELVRPTREHLAGFADALQRGWSPDNLRPASAQETLERVRADPDGFLRLTEDPQGLGPPFALPDGTLAPRLPGLVRWMWDAEALPAVSTCAGRATWAPCRHMCWGMWVTP